MGIDIGVKETKRQKDQATHNKSIKEFKDKIAKGRAETVVANEEQKVEMEVIFNNIQANITEGMKVHKEKQRNADKILKERWQAELKGKKNGHVGAGDIGLNQSEEPNDLDEPRSDQDNGGGHSVPER